jgi:hypothetical protein
MRVKSPSREALSLSKANETPRSKMLAPRGLSNMSHVPPLPSLPPKASMKLDDVMVKMETSQAFQG